MLKQGQEKDIGIEGGQYGRFFLKIDGFSRTFEADSSLSCSHAGGIVSFPSILRNLRDERKDCVDVRASRRSWA